MVGEGAVRWMFERKGMVIAKLEDQPETNRIKKRWKWTPLKPAPTIFIGLKMFWKCTRARKRGSRQKNAGRKGRQSGILFAGMGAQRGSGRRRKNQEQNEKLIEKLTDNDSVQEVYSNLKD